MTTGAPPPAPRPSDRTLVRTQAVSGLVFAVFLALHLVTAVAAIGGEASYEGVLGVVRHYYRFPLVEIVGVVGAVAVHASAGVLRILRRRAKARAAAEEHAGAHRAGAQPTLVPLRERLHRYAGYYLLLFVAGHVVATRAPSLIYGQDPNFAFLHFSLMSLPWWFYPYYALLAACGGYHLVHGVFVALKVLGARLPGRTTSPISRPFWAFAALWAVTSATIVLAFGGVLFAVDESRVEPWRQLLARVLELTGS